MRILRVLLAEDHQLVRAGFRALLDGLPGIEVVSEANNGQEALALIPQVRPDLVLMDISMPHLNGVEATHRITRDFPEVRVIILSMYTTEEYVLQALRAGAGGYLLKDSTPGEFNHAIQAVAKGETYLCSGVAQHVVAYIQRTGYELNEYDEWVDPYEYLTARQRQVLQMVAEGNSSAQIADTLDISIKTVERHRADIMTRLNIHDLPGLVRYAIRMGITGLED
jgi:DNA-binding NarL/FixJ family response regulator